MPKNKKVFFILMFVVLAAVGILQFFAHPKAVDYVLGCVALLLGILGIVFILSGGKAHNPDEYPIGRGRQGRG